MVNEKAAEIEDKRQGIELFVPPNPFKKIYADGEKKSLPKFPCKIHISKYGALEVTVFLNAKYVRKVLGGENG